MTSKPGEERDMRDDTLLTVISKNDEGGKKRKEEGRDRIMSDKHKGKCYGLKRNSSLKRGQQQQE